tara:strand:+ start:131 stop:352 length:222 start_codon:yes stop_codon:yes gene_type:complete
LKKNPQIKRGLVEVDSIARRYNLNPVDLIAPDLYNPFLRLAYLGKIAEAGAEFENKQYEKAEREAERQSKLRR